MGSLDGLQGTVPKGDLFEKLSPTLAQELLLEIHVKWIRKLPFHDALAGAYSVGGVERLKGVADKSLRLFAQLAMRMQPALSISRERPPPRRMYVLISGVVMNTVTKGVCRPGDNWGGMLTITDSKCLLDMYCAVNVVQVVYITHEGLEACVQEHPDFEVPYRKLRAWAYWGRLVRAGGIIRAKMVEAERRAAPKKKQRHKPAGSAQESADVVPPSPTKTSSPRTKGMVAA